MQHLSIEEINEVSGGILPVLGGIAVAAGGTIAFNYARDQWGGALSNFASNVAGAYYSSITTYGYNPYL